MKVSVEANSGTVTVLGDRTFKGVASTPVVLTVGGGVTLVANSNSQPLSGVTINATSGSADVILSLV
jgi:hypothetical protein